MNGVLVGPFYPSGLILQRARLIDAANQAPLGPSVPCRAVIDSCMLKVREPLQLPPSSRAASEAGVLFEVQGIPTIALNVCAFREDGSRGVAAGEVVLIGGSDS